MRASTGQSRVAAVVLLIAGAGVVGLVFQPWRPPGFVSDSWLLFSALGSMDPADVLARFVPNSGSWYRPLTDATYWLLWNLFGINPAASFVLHICSHVTASILLALTTLQLTRNRTAAAFTGIAFLFALQSHEVVWDHSALHFTMSAVPLTAAVFTYVRGSRRISLVFTAVTLVADETGLILLPLLALYEGIYLNWSTSGRSAALRGAALRLAPTVIAVAAYLIAVMAIGGGFYNEVAHPCRTATCIAVGAMEYTNRLVVRPDFLIARIWSHRPEIFVVVTVSLAALLLALRPWRWRDLRPALFGLAWAFVASFFFAFALWDYVADRFVYVPAMGASVLIGGVIPELRNQWLSGGRLGRIGAGIFVALLVGWIGLSALTVFDRGQRWVAAGERALVLAAGVHALVPDPSPGSIVLVYGQPHSLRPIFPPGNTGPYVFLNGMQAAMRVLYDWPDSVLVPRRAEQYTPPVGANLIRLRIIDDEVVLEPASE